jgi:hypothetical protein
MPGTVLSGLPGPDRPATRNITGALHIAIMGPFGLVRVFRYLAAAEPRKGLDSGSDDRKSSRKP